MALILALNRRIVRANARVRKGNFALEGLLVFDLHGCTAGVVGTGKIGAVFCNIARGFGCRVLAYDIRQDADPVSVGIDVYEEEAHLFFRDLSDQVLQDDVFARLLTFPNVLVTGHQAFFTREALANIAETTLASIADEEGGQESANRVSASRVVA